MIPKFRMWHKGERKMYKMGTHFLSFNYKGWHLISSLTGTSLVSNKNGILMQSTGLKDRNGKEIFEGDIINVIGGKYNPYIVEYAKSIASFVLTHRTKSMNLVDKFSNKYSIIGNIYENHELLKVKV